jgi:hypothetical protein
MSKKNACANQAQTRRYRLNHRIPSFGPGAERTTRQAEQSKGFLPGIENRSQLMICSNSAVPFWDSTAAKPTIDLLR